MSCMHALPSFLVHWYVFLCILSYRFVVFFSRFAKYISGGSTVSATAANTCAPSVREWYHTRSPGENILGLKKGHDTLYTAFGERISQAKLLHCVRTACTYQETHPRSPATCLLAQQMVKAHKITTNT